jgi:CRISPR-associated protein Csb1
MSISKDVVNVTDDVLDAWATKPDGPVALRMKQKLLPVEESGIIFPPTYADIGYSIDTLSDGTRMATIDSVGSQANRLEPIFKATSSDRNQWLVPQIEIVVRREDCRACAACRRNSDRGEAKNGRKAACEKPRDVTRSLLDLAHRAADAVVLSSPTLLELVKPAFRALQRGDAGPLCGIAPTSLVFGVWDSRGDTGEKRPRLVRSIIRAWDVEPLHAAAQFNSVWKLLDEQDQEELSNEAKARKVKLSEKGLADAPSVFRSKTKSPQYVNGSPNPEARVLGGVLVRDRIEREVTVNLVALRGLAGKDGTETAAIRKYLLGLSLVAASADIELFLREGCLLRYAENGDNWYEIPRRGEPTRASVTAERALAYARTGAQPFQPKWPEDAKLKHEFNLAEAKKRLAKKTGEEEPAPAG